MSRLSRPRYLRRKTRGFTNRDVGDEIRRVITRGTYRRELATGVATKFNGATIESYSYAYDALSRPTTRNTDAFGYNERGEVISAQIGASQFAHAYDFIGNQTNFVANATTNSYTHNALNQVSTTQEISAPSAPPREIFHDLDGNLTNDTVFTYAYDSENRLATVSSASLTNGAVRVSNSYDYRNRRIGKIVQRYADGGWHATERRTFVYDNWNLIHETVATKHGAITNTVEIQYFWGADISETLQGAGGVGGLLAVSINGDFYFPAYDNNGNITKYIDDNGNVVAEYTYNAFGKTISQTGSLADIFRHRFSTKYFDAETGLYYYGYRFYSPVLMRWLNRDPIGENGDINQYMFVKNTPLQKVDSKGLDWRIARNGGVFAHAIATKNDDTFEMLAGKLRLDVSDYKIWAHTSDTIPRRCKKYKIPNLVVYDYGGRRFMDRLPTHIISLWRGQNNRQAENDEKKGLMVLIRDNVSSGQIESILRTDGLYKYTFTGHGDGEGGINAYPDPFDVSSPVARYTKYGISSMVLQACGSAATESFSEENRKAGIVKHNNWELNVAKAGVFIGYEGAVTLLNELFQWTAAKGANYGASE